MTVFLHPFRLFVYLFLIFYGLNVHANAPAKDLWTCWEVSDPLSLEVIDHRLWEQFLKNHVQKSHQGIHVIDYAHMPSKDRTIIDEYLLHLGSVKISNYNRREQLAFWINLYNALVMKIVLEHYPVDTINDINISPGFFSDGPWAANLIKIENISLSLHDIEHRIIRPIYNDPRTLYALNKAAVGSPNLEPQAFTGVNVDTLLNQCAKEYINSLRGMQLIDNRLVTSSLYKWYIDDFGGTEVDVINHLKEYAAPSLRKQLVNVTTINRTFFNWHLNSVKPHKQVVQTTRELPRQNQFANGETRF